MFQVRDDIGFGQGGESFYIFSGVRIFRVFELYVKGGVFSIYFLEIQVKQVQGFIFVKSVYDRFYISGFQKNIIKKMRWER